MLLSFYRPGYRHVPLENYAGVRLTPASLFTHIRCQFHQRFTHTFFIWKFVHSQNITRKKAFVRKICAFNVDAIDHSVMCSVQQNKNKVVQWKNGLKLGLFTIEKVVGSNLTKSRWKWCQCLVRNDYCTQSWFIRQMEKKLYGAKSCFLKLFIEEPNLKPRLPNFLYAFTHNFSFFAVKLGYFKTNTIVSKHYKRSSKNVKMSRN